MPERIRGIAATEHDEERPADTTYHRTSVSRSVIKMRAAHLATPRTEDSGFEPIFCTEVSDCHRRTTSLTSCTRHIK
jgi:hypothetical protein